MLTRAEASIPLVRPWSVCKEPTGIVFVNVAPLAFAGAVTRTLIVHDPGEADDPAGTLPFVKLTVRGNVVEAVPPQVVVAEPDTTLKTVPGKVSDNVTPV